MPEEKKAKTTKKQDKKISEKEYEKKIVELAKKGMTSEKIGLELKKQEIHPKEFKKKILKVLKENDITLDPDLKNIEKKLERISVHAEKNKQDKKAIREKSRIFSQVRKFKKYRKLI